MAAPNGELHATGGPSCRADDECAVCFRANSCGAPIAASDPAAAQPGCRSLPAAFCMPRHPHCDQGHCAAR